MRFAIIPKALDIPVFNYAKLGAERAAAEFGDVEVLWNAPASADQLKQKEILESYITQRVDGIAISALNGDFLTETINRAIDAGIPVTTWDSDAPKSKRIAFYGVDDLASGRIMGEQAITLLERQGQGRADHAASAPPTCRTASTGVKEALAKAPGHPDRRNLRHPGRRASVAPRSSRPARAAIPISRRGSPSAAGRCSRAMPWPPLIRRRRR